jgi:predicted permease
MTEGRRVYRALLRLYPASFREEYASELAQTYEDSVRERGRAGALLGAIADVVPNALAAHWAILSQDLRYTARSLSGARGFALATILVTALGVGANTATFSVADYVLFRPLAFHDPERLVRMCDGPRRGGGWGCMNQMPAARYRAIVSTNRSFEEQGGVGAFARQAMNLVGEGDPVRISTVAVTPEVLPLLGVRPMIGRLFDTASPRQDAQTVVVSYGLWQSHFGGDPGIIGKPVSLNGQPSVVIGVMPQTFRFPTDETQLWTPLLLTEEDYANLGNNRLEVTARLKPGVTFEQAQADVNAIADRLHREQPEQYDENSGFSFFKQRDEMSPRYRVMLLALVAASLCMLLLTCANLANLMLARAAGRERELAVRAALGAGRERLMRQLLTESVTLALLGGIAGAVVAVMAVPLLGRLVPATLPIASQPTVDLRVFAIAAMLSALTGLGFGLLPAMRIGGTTGFAALREGTRGSASRQRLRTVLVAIEVTVSVVLLIGSGLLIRAMLRVEAIDPGFSSDRVLSVQTALPLPKYNDRDRREGFYRRVLADVRALPGVEAAGYMNGLPFVMTGVIARVLFPGEEDRRDGTQNASYRVITPQFFDAMRIPIRQGRDFRDDDTRERELVAVVSESFVQRRLPGQSAIGRTIEVRGETRAIVGVVGDIMVRGLERTSEPQLYLPVNQARDTLPDAWMPKELLVRSSIGPAALLPGIRQAIRNADAQQPISNVRMLSELVGDQTAARRAQVRVLGALAALALILAAVGIHGLLAFTVAQRDREIGVRLALGADPGSVRRMIVTEGVRMAVMGVVPGVIIAYLAARGMSSLLFGVRPEDPVTIGVVAVLCFGTTVAACVAPAIRAARIEPITALKSD